MITNLEHFIDPAYVYRFSQGPDKVRTITDAQERGINCVSLAHLAIRHLFGRTLPEELMCYEMFADTAQFDTVGSLDQMQAGDLIWFGIDKPEVPLEDFQPSYNAAGELENWWQSPVKHVAIYTGQQTDDYQLLHATHLTGTNVVWPLRQFAAYERYRKIYRISRLLQETNIQ